MSIFGTARTDAGRAARVSVGQGFTMMFGPTAPVRFSAYDGSSAGRPDAPIHLRLTRPRGLAYILGAPTSLGFARAYVAGDLEIDGVHPGDPYPLLRTMSELLEPPRLAVGDAVRALRTFAPLALSLPEPPPQEVAGPFRRAVRGMRHSRTRDAAAIHHHYDVSNRFYELVLGSSMTYTCACFPEADSTLEQAQANKYDLVARKLGLRPGMRLLDVGCGWGGMVRHAVREYGVTAVGVTLSGEQAAWATQAIEREGLAGRAQVRHQDYRAVSESGFDAVSSIGLSEHIGVANYPAYFTFLRSRLRPGGRLLNHSITRPDNRHPGIRRRGFIDRYVFPDGELTGSGAMITAMQDAGLEVQHEENLRRHYALTLRDWGQNLVESWDEAVVEVGAGTARVWGLYMAGSRLSFERGQIELHQVLATRTEESGDPHYPMRPDFGT